MKMKIKALSNEIKNCDLKVVLCSTAKADFR